MLNTAKEKMLLSDGITLLRIFLLLAVALCLPETRLWNFKTATTSVSAKISGFHPVVVGNKQPVWHYDASDTAYPLLGDVTKAGVKPLFGKPASAVAKGGNILANTYKLASPSSHSGVLQFNRAAYDNFLAGGGMIVRQRSEQLFSPISGKLINGYFDQVNNTIVLGKGSNLGTLTEELIHFRQAQQFGRRIPTNMKNLMEIDAAER